MRRAAQTMKKKHIRTVVDMAMIVLLPMLMAYSLIGEKLHEIIGTILFALFIVHHVLNRQWYKAIFNGKYTPRRIFQTVQAMGKALESTALSMIREILFGVGFALLLPIRFGLDGVLYSMPLSDFLTFLIAAWLIIRTYKVLETGQKNKDKCIHSGELKGA